MSPGVRVLWFHQRRCDVSRWVSLGPLVTWRNNHSSSPGGLLATVSASMARLDRRALTQNSTLDLELNVLLFPWRTNLVTDRTHAGI